MQGQATWDVSPASFGTQDAFSVELPGVAPVPLTDANVNFAPPELVGVTPDTDATCTGTVDNPTAPAGKVCIYIYGATGMLQLEGGAPTYLADQAFEITWLARLRRRVPLRHLGLHRAVTCTVRTPARQPGPNRGRGVAFAAWQATSSTRSG